MNRARISLFLSPIMACMLAVSAGCLKPLDTHSGLEYVVTGTGADLVRVYYLDEHQVLNVYSTGTLPWSSYHYIERGHDAKIWVEASNEDPDQKVCITVQALLDGRLWQTDSRCGQGVVEATVAGYICREGECQTQKTKTESACNE